MGTYIFLKKDFTENKVDDILNLPTGCRWSESRENESSKRG